MTKYYTSIDAQLKKEATHKSLGTYFKKVNDKWLMLSQLEAIWIEYTPRNLEYFLSTLEEIN